MPSAFGRRNDGQVRAGLSFEANILYLYMEVGREKKRTDFIESFVMYCYERHWAWCMVYGAWCYRLIRLVYTPEAKSSPSATLHIFGTMATVFSKLGAELRLSCASKPIHNKIFLLCLHGRCTALLPRKTR
jgi:hypothetical protein